MPTDRIPPPSELLPLIVDAIRALGGSATTDEINQRIISAIDLSEEAQLVLRSDGHYPRILHNISDSRARLKKIAWISQSPQGVWSVTDEGETQPPEGFARVHGLYRAALDRERAEANRETGVAVTGEPTDPEPDGADDADEPATWQELLLDRLLRLDPAQFERVAQRLLREAGFSDVEVTGRGADGGIDGVGQYRLGLLTFPVYWQSKRWSRSVSAPDVQGFRGALSTQVGARGLFVTTSTFTLPARQEASKPPQIDLVDGERLAELMREYDLGVQTTVSSTEEIFLTMEFFDTL